MHSLALRAWPTARRGLWCPTRSNRSPRPALQRVQEVEELALLHRKGFQTTVRISDLAAHDRDVLSQRAARSSLPSGTDDYRHLPDIQAAIKALHAELPAAAWRANLEQYFDVDLFLRWLAVNQVVDNWDACVDEVGEGTARVWGLYMAGSRLAFERNEIQLHHVLATKTDEEGSSGYPLRHTFGA